MTHEPDSSRKAPRAVSESVAQAAAEWVLRRDRGLAPNEVQQLVDWLAVDPDHAAEFARINGVWRSMDAIKAEPGLMAMADAIEARAKNRPRRRKWNIVAMTLGFTAAAAIAVIFVRPLTTPAIRKPVAAVAAVKPYVVLVSTARRIDLPDGSVAELNGDSQIEVDFTPTVRQVKLLNGEALFSVAKNPNRPFVVSAGSVTVRAVGTAFNVLLAPGSVQVLVTEGKVRLGEVEAPIDAASTPTPAHNPIEAAVIAGERAVVQTNALAAAPVAIETPTLNEIERALAWKSTQLVFDHTPLDQVVAAFNQYNVRSLVLAEPSLKSRTLTGSFSAENLDGFTRLLRASVDVIAESRGDDQILLRPAP
jgi:transmembrane sensor